MKRHVADHTATDGRTHKGNHVTFLKLYMGIGQIRRHIGMLIWLEKINGILCCFGGYTYK